MGGEGEDWVTKYTVGGREKARVGQFQGSLTQDIDSLLRLLLAPTVSQPCRRRACWAASASAAWSPPAREPAGLIDELDYIVFWARKAPLFFNIWEPVAPGSAEAPRLWPLRISFHNESTPIDPDLM